jgi:hypothetical protein
MQAYSQDKKPGIVFTWQFEKARLSEAIQSVKELPGLHYYYFEKFFVTTADLDAVEPISHGITSKFSIDEKKRDTYFGFRFSGFIKMPKDGIYTFYLKSNDGSRLYIDGEELIENDANHGAVEEPGKVALKAGLHKIMVKYFQCGGGKTLQVSWSGPGVEKQEISASVLFHREM